MRIPTLLDEAQVLVNQSSDSVQIPRREPTTAGELHRLKPEFAGCVVPFDVDVWRLVAVEAEEEEPVRTREVLDSRHELLVCFEGTKQFLPGRRRSASVRATGSPVRLDLIGR
jgi:hypothetical protein